jgi:hypothetical protein
MIIVETLNPAANPVSGPSPPSGSMAHDQHAPVAVPYLRLSDANISLATPSLRRPQPSPPPSAAKTQSLSATAHPRHGSQPTKITVAPFTSKRLGASR